MDSLLSSFLGNMYVIFMGKRVLGLLLVLVVYVYLYPRAIDFFDNPGREENSTYSVE